MSNSWIFTFVTAVVAVCAILAAFGFKGRVTTVGVDLGTTFSVVGVNINGKVVIVDDKKGHNIFPSVVSYRPGGDIIVGYDALPYLSLSPEQTIFNAKRFMGRNLAELDVQTYAASHSYKVVETNISEHGQVGFEIRAEGHVPVVTPESVGSEVLRHLMKLTANFLGHKQVNKAVIAVPAKFNAAQRQATAAAFKAANLKVVRVLEEPTAAAVAYRLHKKQNIHHILVYDFGGGTLDVSLLYVSKGSVQVYATDGDDTLGGSDLDFCLYDIIKNKTEYITGASLQTFEQYSTVAATKRNSGDKGNDANKIDSLCLPANIRNSAEKIKKALSTSQSAEFSCVAPGQEGEIEVSFSLSRDDFELGCDALFQRGMEPVRRLLVDLEMNPSDVDEVVLVGGSTRVPRVKRDLRSYFGKDLNDHIDPDVTVAYGAASVLD